jgi:sterol desaturase/sphingolipid hydroxylase (fatty acid hydroxylase superfamily)
MIKEILHSPAVLFSLVFPFRFLIGNFLERRFFAHDFDRRAAIRVDLASMALVAAVFFPAAQYTSNKLGFRLPISHRIDSVPLPLRIAMYVVVADFCHYWLHRLIHQPLLWRLHQWHHAPTHMSWAAGYRETFFDATIVNLAYVFAWPLLGSTTYRLQLVLLVFVLIKNDWMHLNVRWRMSWLEWLIVTPRYHHIHHSTDVRHHNKNLATVFPIWDRLFGTYMNPDEITGGIEFGIGEKVPTARLIAGV